MSAAPRRRGLRSLRNQHEAFIAKVKASGGRVLDLRTPCCSKDIEVQAPRGKHEVWDSLMTCPHCGQLFMEVVDYRKARGFAPIEGVVLSA